MSTPASETLGQNDYAQLKALSSRLPATRLADRARFTRELDRLFGRRSRGNFDKAVASLSAAMEASAARVEALRSLPLKLDYDPALPITAHRQEILDALEQHPVIVVCGATGSGKSTQLPKFCLEAGRGAFGLIGHTQPRRIAARALANRLATELGTSVGGAVGYQVRFNDHTGPDCRVKLMTDGILLKELESDRLLRRYDTLIIDEAHERSLNIDLLLGILRQLQADRPDLKIVITSATIDPEKFSRFFDGAPVIEVSGRSYPVEVRYRPLLADDEDAAELSLPEGIVEAVRELSTDSNGIRGDVLVFLPGEKHIREAAEALQRARLANTEVLPLYARLSMADQERIFQPHTQRRVVLATNVAETSLTVPGIRFVVDCGLARVSRYSVRGKVQRLPVEHISRASAEQRKGRCGREGDGICIRLFSEEDFTQREEFTPPEILRTNLASVLLRMAVLNLGEPESFPFLDAPDTRLVNDGVRLLQELKAMDEHRRVTSLGRQLASFPVDPRLARMLVAAAHHKCLAEMLIIAAFLETQDPRERPTDAQQQADEKHAVFADARSDFVAVLNLWRALESQAQVLSRNQLRKWCREHFISFLRVREWQELHAQLVDITSDLELLANEEPAGYADLHRAILTGFLGFIGRLDEKRELDGARGTRFVIAPGTPLAARPPRWVVAASLLETTRLYARMVAAVQPAWIEAAGEHLLKRNYSDPHWVQAHGFVAAYESVSLYGLTLVARRRVNYGSIAPLEAREIFVREALVEGKMTHRGPFLEANLRLRSDIEGLEARIRRRDILVDEGTQADFYLKRIPERVSSVGAFERWRADAERNEPRVLFMSPEQLMRREAPEAGPEYFPDHLRIGANRLPLQYKFEPAQADDGVTLIVPEPLVDLLNGEQLAWLVPGLRLEKITAVLRALPKAVRKELVPVPEHARRAFDELSLAGDEALPGFHEWMSQWITRTAGTAVSASQIAALVIPDHLRMNVRVIDDADRIIAESRDLPAIKRKLHSAPVRSRPSALEPLPALHRQWAFGELHESTTIERNRLSLVVYPAIQDRGNGVCFMEARSAAEAAAISREGIMRLATLALPQQSKMLRKRIAEDRELILLAQGLTLERPLPDALTDRAFRECFVPDDAPLPRTREAFEKVLDTHRAAVSDVADSLTALVTTSLREWRAVRAALEQLASPVFQGTVADVQSQLAALMPPDLLRSTPRKWLNEIPRYLKAISRRLERARGNVSRDMELSRKVKPFESALHALASQPAPSAAIPAFEQLRWMIEELRVSLFAQELRTIVPVSEKRLADQLARARAAARM